MTILNEMMNKDPVYVFFVKRRGGKREKERKRERERERKNFLYLCFHF
jgi:hypothetical protein